MAKEFEGLGPDQELTDFYLFGHSLGGYMVGNYALKYPQHVKKLILSSPAGVRVVPEDEEKPDNFLRSADGKAPNGCIRWMGKVAFNKKISPY